LTVGSVKAGFARRNGGGLEITDLGLDVATAMMF
jgi:hypothetical protein